MGVEDSAVAIPGIRDARLAIDAAVGKLDEGNAALDEPARQEAALAELVAAVLIAEAGRLLVQVEGCLGRGPHQTHGAVVSGLVALRR